MSLTYTQKLYNAIAKANSCLCVGLDPYPDRIPDQLVEQYPDEADRILYFLEQVIEATHPYCAAYKPNLAFFEALGTRGLEVLANVLSAIPDDKIIIGDAKRGDIGSTSAYYRKSLFDQFSFDAVTLNPLMGFETLFPYADYPDKGIYLLTLTSNPGSADFLSKPFAGYPSMAEYISASAHILQDKFQSHIGMVVGATRGAQLADVIKHHPEGALLIPGVGSQGGSIKEVAESLGIHRGLPLVSSSRSILYPNTNSGEWKKGIAQQATEYKSKLSSITNQYV